jgi:hypothetical protein
VNGPLVHEHRGIRPALLGTQHGLPAGAGAWLEWRSVSVTAFTVVAVGRRLPYGGFDNLKPGRVRLP